MVQPLEHDARGILDPAAASKVFRLERHLPAAELRRFVDRYWIVRWEAPGEPYVQPLLTHPAVNITVDATGASVHGVRTGVTEQVLSGSGIAFGIMFRPAGFRPFVDGPLSVLTDRTLPVDAMLRGAEQLDGLHLLDDEAMVERANRYLQRLAPRTPQPSEATTALVDWIAASATVTRVEAVAAHAGVSVRQLQRRFGDHVGIGPKAVLRRYRFYAASERARTAAVESWANAAATLGYSDQAHLSKEFREIAGVPPQRYSRRQRGGR